MRANFPASMHSSTFFPSCSKNDGFVNAVCARIIAAFSSPSRGNLEAIDTAFFQSPRLAASLSVCNFVFIESSLTCLHLLCKQLLMNAHTVRKR